MSAIISDCEKYRYLLERKVSNKDGTMLFIMLNPSTADAELDDPTIRKCVAFAMREGYGLLKVVNLFAWRATKPSDMKSAPFPVGTYNDAFIKRAATDADCVICGWGVHGSLYNRAENVLKLLKEAGIPLLCLGTTKDGHPKHPCYLAHATKLEPYGAAGK